MAEDNRKFLGEILVQRGLVTKSDIDDAIKEQKKNYRPLGLILITKNLITEEQLLQVLSEQTGYPYVDLDTEPVSIDAFKSIPEAVCKQNTVVAISRDKSVIRVAMADPLNLGAIEAVQAATGLRVQPCFATTEKIKRKIDTLISQKIMQASKPRAEAAQERPSADQAAEREAAQSSVIKVVNQMIEKGVSMRASDIHLDPEEKALALKMRLDGILTDVDKLPKYLEAAVISRIKIMAGMDIAEKRLPQDGRVNVKIAGKDIDLRVASFPTVYGEKMTLRILDKSRGIFKLEELGMSGDYLKIYESVIAKPHGIIFVCGPTGCGKSTTLYSTLSILDKVKNNVMTLEDPVEYLIPRTKQSQINVKAGLTFAVGLRSMLRQDPDIIMIGEVRDRETAEISIHSALTGHLVFSTIHTNDAPSAVARLIDMDIEPFLIASSLSAVLSQRLVRVLCKKCRKKGARVPQEILDRFNISKPEAERICEPIGCKECNSTGYHGRVGVFELLIINDVLREAIIKKSSQHILKKLAIEGGMKPMLLNGIEKVLEGVTSLEEVVRVAETTA